MFPTLSMNFGRLLPQIKVADLWRTSQAMHQNAVDPAEMPESWQRDLGLLDGRGPRGDVHHGAAQASRMISLPRGL
ncbi:hypothetical protein CYG48_09795 [Neorhizobium sp. SOG26]|uniref:hypothetical protein n=1 Tax=Neorhizobium sp. SOG26 TaxID=2060726 RepID=UPI000E58382A|nr:hypothetical protein [Neorhizobium sp. SOG26]AXV15962.1 hypothetical protein CYG48_09795 [Neorhizobium sp. SOG26]